MIQCFFDDVDNLLPKIRAALEKGDLEEVGRLGHRLKGTVVYLAQNRPRRLRCEWSDLASAKAARWPQPEEPSMHWSMSVSR